MLLCLLYKTEHIGILKCPHFVCQTTEQIQIQIQAVRLMFGVSKLKAISPHFILGVQEPTKTLHYITQANTQ